MYIGSTNLYLNLPEYNTNASASWIASEKYDNCDNFFQHLVAKQQKRKLFQKKDNLIKVK